MWRPGAIDDTWIEQMMDRLDLVRPIGDDKVPTLAGWLLFSGPVGAVCTGACPVSGHGPRALAQGALR